jgi:protoheme ferro-lyase
VGQLRLPPSPRSAARLVFTAHSIAVAMAGAARYRAQLLESSRLVADRLGIADWALVFQSRCRRRGDPWLEPNICQYPRAERARSRPAAVICPMGSFCDEMEVLYDLDVGFQSQREPSRLSGEVVEMLGFVRTIEGCRECGHHTGGKLIAVDAPQ